MTSARTGLRLLTVCVCMAAVTGCRPAPKAPVEPKAIEPAAVQPPAPPESTPLPIKAPSPRAVERSREIEPLGEAAITAQRTIAESTTDYASRIEARRGLLNRLRASGQVREAVGELQRLTDDVERAEGSAMAQRVAFAEAVTYQNARDFDAAFEAYALLTQRWPDGTFASQAHFEQGSCRLEQHRYAEAGQIWQRFVEERDGDHRASQAWRRLALAQLLQGQFDGSLSTLQMMAEKYVGDESGYYARMRQGYVLMAAGRLREARSAFDRFLEECGTSKYCTLARDHLDELAKLELAIR